MAEVFISYSRKDRDFVARLQEALSEHQREAWLDTKDIPPTAEWLQEIYAAIEKADAFVFVISPDSVLSKVCQLEIAHAVKHHKRLIPVVCREPHDKAAPEPLPRLNWLFLRDIDDFETSFQTFLTALTTDLEHVRTHTRLLTRALDWEGKGQDRSLLLRGSELMEAEAWLAASGDKEPQPTDRMRQFLLASRQGATRRQRFILGAVSTALVVAVSLALVAFYHYREAGRQKESALARGLAAQSELLRSQQPLLLNRSVLLAIESCRRRPTLEGSLALHRGLALMPKRLATTPVEGSLALNSIKLSPDGAWLAGLVVARNLSVKGGVVWVCDAKTGRLVTSLPPEDSHYLLVAFSSDSQRVITFTEKGSLRVTAVPDGRAVSHRTVGLRRHWMAALSPDGKLLAVGEGGPRVHVYDTTTGRELANLTLADDIKALVFTPDSAELAVGCMDGVVELWQISAGSSLARFKIPRYVESLAISPEGQYLAAMMGKKTEHDEETEVLVWDLPTRQVAARITQEGECYRLAFSQNGLLMTASRFKGVTVWRISDGREVFRVKPPSSSPAVLSPTGKWLSVGGQVYDLTTGREARRLPTPGGIFFSSDGRWLFTSDDYGAARWQIDGFEDVVHLSDNLSPDEMAFSPDGKLLVTIDTSLADTVPVWETATGRQLYDLKPAVRAMGAFFSPDGKLLALLDHQLLEKVAMVGVYDTATGKLASRIADPNSHAFGGFRPDSRALFTIGDDNLRKVWDPATAKLLETIPSPKMPPHLKEGAKVFSPDGKWFCGVGKDQILRVWEVDAGREVFQLGRAWDVFRAELLGDTKIANYYRIIFSNTGQYLAAVAVKGDMAKDHTAPPEVIAWEVASGRKVVSVDKPLKVRDKFTAKPTFAPSGKILAVATEDNLVKLIDLTTGGELAQLKHEGEVTDMTFSGDSRWLATGSGDRTARVWELPVGREAARLEHPNQVTKVAFNPGGNRLATSCGDSQVRLWYWRPNDFITAACSRLLHNLSRKEWRQYLGDEPYRPTCPNLPTPEE